MDSLFWRTKDYAQAEMCDLGFSEGGVLGLNHDEALNVPLFPFQSFALFQPHSLARMSRWRDTCRGFAILRRYESSGCRKRRFSCAVNLLVQIKRKFSMFYFCKETRFHKKLNVA